MADECDSPDMRAVLDFTLANARWFDSGSFKSKGLTNWLVHLLHARNDNTRAGSKRNIAHHYDLGNDFYTLWLDPSMTYSSAVFDSSQSPNSLETAQMEKYRRLAQMVGLKPGDRVLEIGCGWGDLLSLLPGMRGACDWSDHQSGTTNLRPKPIERGKSQPFS